MTARGRRPTHYPAATGPAASVSLPFKREHNWLKRPGGGNQQVKVIPLEKLSVAWKILRGQH
jgi:hypothetical protein